GDDRSVVIGVGGGALLDTAKALARRLGLPFVAVQTIAATCAAWTRRSVWYNDAGQGLDDEILADDNSTVLEVPDSLFNPRPPTIRARTGVTHDASRKGGGGGG
ncbi:iron-containing alcohol dehydrogenase, partial [Escherichia coli]|uniref:iron-containing alcohol dehydrogenase n=1 Tax=Escherichia coli TaxID=562 RepID=UPI002024A323